jgi:hypothetical protein
LQAVVRQADGAWDEACRLLDPVCAGDAAFARAWAARGECRAALGRHDLARADFATALELEPSASSLRAFVALALRAGDAAGATAATAAAHERGVVAKDVDDILRMVAFGPEWARRYSYASANYDVVSEIDQESSRRAAEVLEEARRFFAADLGKLDRQRPQRSTVYLFVGESGYQAYCKRIFGGTAPHTAGLYSPIVKQLLIWNLPDREEMWRTVRHEALHQYLDEVAGAVVLWLNEGLAENYELCESATRTAWRLGKAAMQRAHLGVLTAKGLTPLPAFLTMSPAQFYSDPAHNYAQSWALVRLLLHGEPRHRALFQRLCDGLRTEPATAVARAFVDVDLAQLERELAEAVASWR